MMRHLNRIFLQQRYSKVEPGFRAGWTDVRDSKPARRPGSISLNPSV